MTAQGIPGNPIQRSADAIGRTGQALGRTAGVVQDTIGNSVGRVTRGVQNTTQRVLRPNAPVVHGTRNYSTNGNGYGHAAAYSSYHHGSHHGNYLAAGDGYPSGVVQSQAMPHDVAHDVAHPGQSYRLMHDATGREYICVGGERVYFDGNTHLDGVDSSQEMNQTNGRYEAGYGSYDSAEDSFDAPPLDGSESNASQSQQERDASDRAPNARANEVRSDVSQSVNAEADADVNAAARRANDNVRAQANGSNNANSGINTGTSEEMLRQSTTAGGQQHGNASTDSFGGDSDLGSAAKDAVTGDLGNE
ncbi:MAG: hypothetical protein ACF787_11890 [Rhodopirellula sp. JB053]